MAWVRQVDMDRPVGTDLLEDMDPLEDHLAMDLQVLVHKECMAHPAQEAHQVECMAPQEDLTRAWGHPYHLQEWDPLQ